jgi:16S rRNA (adenine1518-N6/adenine1519-N6)-dimethyltransferase
MRPARPRARKRFGQHFLASSWAQKVVAAIAPQPGDVFLEVGPGRGAITLPLAASGVPLLAVEIDRDLVADLAPRVPPNVTLISGDFLKTDVLPFVGGLEPSRPPAAASEIGPPRRLRVAGNLPYNLTSPIIFRLLELQARHHAFSDATLMVQKEVADRLTARVGTKAYGVLTVMVRLHTDVTRLMDLPPGAFRPAPKVRSSVVRLAFGPAQRRVRNLERFERIVKAAFGQRRKTLANALKSFGNPAELLHRADIDPRRRAETLDLDDFARLTEASGT